MAYTAYDWQQTLAEKADYAEGRMRRGSPVVALGYDEGILMLSVYQHQPKLYEIYDRLALGALGAPSDLEWVRQFAVDFAHAEGYQRSTEDVSIQRVVGFAISPAIKRAFSDPSRLPIVLRAAFAQVGDAPEHDHLFVLGYDGEFRDHKRLACVAGEVQAEARMAHMLAEVRVHNRKSAVQAALRAWCAGRWQPETDEGTTDGGAATPSLEQCKATLDGELEGGAAIEAVVLERGARRERRYQAIAVEAGDAW